MSTTRTEIRIRLPLAQFALDVDVSSSSRSLGIFGPSGAGKTTLIETLAGWRTPAAGRIRIGQVVLFDDAEGVCVPIERRGAGYVPQDALLFPHWTVSRNLSSGAKHRDSEAEEAALLRRTVAILEIAHLLDRPSTKLSGGERQRVALARALMSRPRFLLLDEPLGSLDLPLRRRILPYLIRVQEEFGLPTIFVSHDAIEVQALCEEVVVLEAGRVQAQGAPDQVLRHVRAGECAFENVLSGTVSSIRSGTAAVRLDEGGEARIPALGLSAGVHVLFAIGSDEILISLDPPKRISARNVVPAIVGQVTSVDDNLARVDGRLESGQGAQLSISVTQSSADELGLRTGQAVFLVFKTSSCRVLSHPS